MDLLPRWILHLTSCLNGYGEGQYLRHLAAAQQDRGDVVIVAGASVDPNALVALEASGIEVESLQRRWQLDPVAALRLADLRRRVKFDQHFAWDLASLALLLATDWGAADAAPCSVVLDRPHGDSPGAGVLVRRAWRAGAKFAATTDAAAGWLAAVGVPEHQIAAPPPGVGEPLPSMPPCQLRAELGLASDAILIAASGPLERRKSLEEAIWAFELVRILHPGAHLVLWGDGADRARLERFAALASEPSAVHFPGYRANVRALWGSVDVFWQLGRTLGIPHALQEAMAAGAAIVAADIPPHRLAIRQQHSGILVPPNDRPATARATDELLSNSNSRRQLGRNAADEARTQWPLKATLAALDPVLRGRREPTTGDSTVAVRGAAAKALKPASTSASAIYAG